MACFSKDCHWFKGHGDCFYDGVPPSNSPSACEECRFFKAPTNADKLRSMSDEELAEFITARHYTPHCPVPQCEADETTDCEQCWLAWLRKESEDG